MDIQQAQQLAKLVLSGEATPEQKAALRQYIDTQAHLPEIENLLLPLEELKAMPVGELPAGMETRVLQSITGEDAALHTPNHAIVRKLVRVGAAAAIIVAICLVSYHLFIPSPSSQNKVAVLMDTVVVPPGHWKELTMADGTRIRLNGGTSLCFPRTFSGTSREVYLDGEAFFEVSKDPGRPFIVYSPAFTTTVLGTSFNIKSSSAYQFLSEVAVATGKVRVAASNVAGAVTFLLPGEKTSYRSGDPAGLITGKTDISTIGSWKDRHFYYTQTPLARILHDLECAYGLQFRMEKPVDLTCTFSVTFKDMKPEEILTTLSLMSSIKFTKKENLVEVSGDPCN